MSGKNYNKPMSAEESRQVLRRGGIMMVLAIVFIGAMAILVHTEAIRLYPTSMNAEMVKGLAGRLEFALRYQTLLVAWLLFNIMATIYGRVTTKAINPLDEKSEQNIIVYKCILQNSFEQIVLSVFAQLIYVSFASPECVLKTIPLVNILQFIGRIAFYYGYPLKRGFGFHCTAWPTVVLVGYNIYSFVRFLVM